MNKFPQSAKQYSKGLLIATLTVLSFQVGAEEAAQTSAPKTISFGDLKKNITEDNKPERLVLAKSLPQASGSGKTRAQIEKASAEKAEKMMAQGQVQSSSFYHSFNIYDAKSYLSEDIDFDGFYRSFSVVFDADVVTTDFDDVSEVYAQLYLSRNGGPWVHYFTTENFLIVGESPNDEYEVVTTLLDGYVTDHYDVLVDLYEVGYPDVVATISAFDVNELYALPLESANYDYQEPPVYVSESHGSGGA